MSLVQVTIVGYIAKEPETKFTPGGKKVLEFSVAHKNYKEETEWYNCAVWNEKRVDALSWLAKGMGVYITGELNVAAKDDKIYRNVNVKELQIISGGNSQPVEDDIPF